MITSTGHTVFRTDSALYDFKRAVEQLQYTPISDALMRELRAMVVRVESELDIRDHDAS